MDGNHRRGRTSIKSRHPDWKEKLRQCCLFRVKNEKSQLLWRIRSGRTESPEGKEVVSAIRDIVTQEVQKFKQSSFIGTRMHQVPKGGESIWEYDGQDLEIAVDIEDEDLLLEMERLLYEDLREELIRRELEYFEKEDEYLAQAVMENMNISNSPSKDNKIWCPICKQGELREVHRCIYCTGCNLRLDLENDKVNIDFLRDRLGEVHLEHLDRGCKAVPKFCMQIMFNLTALCIECEACKTFEIVL